MSGNMDLTDQTKREFYQMMDSIAETADPIDQNKRIKEAEFAEDSREPNAEEVEAIRHELVEDKNHGMQEIILSRFTEPRLLSMQAR